LESPDAGVEHEKMFYNACGGMKPTAIVVKLSNTSNLQNAEVVELADTPSESPK
jgi:hypothetical protein